MQRYLRDENFHVQSAVIKALGRLRHVPATEALIQRLGEVLREKNDELDGLEAPLIAALGRIGGTAAYCELERAYPLSRHPSQVMHALIVRRDLRALEHVERLIQGHSNAGNAFVAALSWRDIDEFKFPRTIEPWLKHEALFEIVRSAAEMAAADVEARSLADLVRAVATFELISAHGVLERIAAGMFLPRDHTNDAIQDARHILASRGHPRHARLAIDGWLDNIQSRRWAYYRDAEQLSQWGPALVREALLARLARETSTPLFLLQFFARDEDRAIFEHFVRDEDVRIADIAHRYLER